VVKQFDQLKINALMAHFPELLPCGCEYEVRLSVIPWVLLIILVGHDRDVGGAERAIRKFFFLNNGFGYSGDSYFNARY
jgi:hypothetical protein